LQKKYSEKVGKRKELQSTMKARRRRTSGVSDIVILTLHGSGLSTSRSRNLLVHGQHKSTSWIDIQSLRFTRSSAQLYKWLEQLYPSLFERVKEKIHDGRFQFVGGSWVENDTNLPSGEALVRQMLFGQRYFETKFGKRCETAWLPDSFGLSGSLPQLIRGAGMKYFFYAKKNIME